MTHLPGKHTERKHIRCLGGACVDEPKHMRGDELRSDPTEQPLCVYIGPTSGEREREGRSQATEASNTVVVGQDVPLEKSEHAVAVYERRRCTILTLP